jgi:phage shock protein A
MNAMRVPKDQVNDVTVELRIAKFESDLGHVKKDVAQISENVGKLQEGLAAANKATADLRTDLAVAKGELSARIKDEVGDLRKEMQAEFRAVREEISGARENLGKEIGEVRESLGKEISAIKATLPQFATKADLNEAIHRLESQMIRWFIITSLGAGSLAFTIAKFVN